MEEEEGGAGNRAKVTPTSNRQAEDSTNHNFVILIFDATSLFVTDF